MNRTDMIWPTKASLPCIWVREIGPDPVCVVEEAAKAVLADAHKQYVSVVRCFTSFMSDVRLTV